MARRFRKPFFGPIRGLWYVWHDGRQVNLGPDEVAAFAVWHKLTSNPSPIVAAAEAVKLFTVMTDSFLEYVQQRRKPDTYRW